jgi:cytoskeletal protein CcmA (bactofilin family)
MDSKTTKTPAEESSNSAGNQSGGEATPSKAPAANALDTPASSDGSGAGAGSDGVSAGNGGPAGGGVTANAKPAKKLSPIKKFLKRFNLYLLIFVFLVVIAGAVTVVSFLNSRKTPETPAVATQELTPEALKQLANSAATVGGSGQTLTVQGSAIFSGQVLVKGDLGVAGTIQAGQGMTVPQLTVSGTSNLGTTQISALQVAQTTTMQGALTLQSDLNVSGAASFSGPITASQITVTRLIMSGNASLQIPNHIAFPGASPGRTITPTVLGQGGSASINGSDTTGTISINTGNGTVPGCFANITFTQKFTSTPHVLVSPVGSGAGQTQYYVDRNVNGFSVCTANAAPTSQAFAYDYFVTQ